MNFIKLLFKLVIVLVVIVVAAIVIVPMVVDPNDYKDDIVKVVKDETGRDLVIKDSMELSVFPWLGVKLANVSLSKADGFGDGDFAKIGLLNVQVKLLPLLSKQVEVSELVLTDLSVHLQTQKSGKTSWEDLQSKDEKGTSTESENTNATDSADASSPSDIGINIGGVSIKNATLIWDDATKGEHLVINGINLETGALSPGEAFDMSLALSLVREMKNEKLDMDLSLSSSILMNDGFQKIKLSNLAFDVTASGEQVPGGKASISLKAKVDSDLAAGTLSISDMKISGPEINMSGNVAGTGLNTKPSFNGKLKLAETNLKNLLAILGVVVETQDAVVLTKVSADFAFSATDHSIKLNPLTLVLDDSSIKGFINVTDFNGPAINLNLELDEIDVDRYLPPKADVKNTTAVAKATGQTSEKAATGDQFAALKKLKLDSKFTIGKLKVNNLKSQNIVLVAKANNGVINLNPMSAEMYQGKYNGQVMLNVAKSKPETHAKSNLDGIEIGQLLKDLMGEDKLTGKGDVHFDLRVKGIEEVDIKKSLNGTLDFKFNDGAYHGFDIAGLIRQVKGGAASSDKPKTDFAEMSASATIVNGVVTNNDLKAVSPLLRINGKGTVNLPKNTIDYLATTKLVASLEGQGGSSSDKLSGVPIGVKLTGDLTKPDFSMDFSGAVKEKVKEKIEEKKAELKEKLQDKLKGKAGGKLDSVLKSFF